MSRPAKAARPAQTAQSAWLRDYYAVRFAVAALWVAAAFTLAKASPPLAVVFRLRFAASPATRITFGRPLSSASFSRHVFFTRRGRTSVFPKIFSPLTLFTA